VHRTTTETTASCVVRHLPEGSFASVPDMEFVCTTHDPRKGAHLIRAALVTASNGLTVTPAMRTWSALGWYGMAGYAALRAACCPDAPAIELPEPAKNCAPIGPVLDEIGKGAVSGANLDDPLERFQTAIGCEVENRRAAAFWQKGRPGGAEPTALRGLLESVAKPRPAE
jgi:serine/threonine-protein kinase